MIVPHPKETSKAVTEKLREEMSSAGTARYRKLDEFQLMRAIKDKDIHALEELMRRYACNVTACIMNIVKNKEVAEEAVSATFLRIWRYAHTWREEAVSTWIFAIARNCGRDAIRPVRLATIPLESVPEAEDPMNPQAAAISDEAMEIIESCIAKLGPDKDIFEQRIYWKISTEVIAAQLGISEDDVNYALRRARRKVRACIAKKLGIVRPMVAEGD